MNTKGKPVKSAPVASLADKPYTPAMSVGNICTQTPPGPKTNGIKIRGTGAATKGTKARGPMA